ncbi:MAG TPA: OsmC family peroxiredoxin [Actinomycetaceae bacterium]|nr:OsmC family peroxiredoxin [Actinomycetaceae bacterium]
MPRPIVNRATTVWNGDLVSSGSGKTTFETSGLGTFDVNWKARAEESGAVTTPEELIAAAHATCFSMQFAHMLSESGHVATSLKASAEVIFVAGEGITGIRLTVEGDVPGIEREEFLKTAESAKEACPVSQALKAVDITLEASLV